MKILCFITGGALGFEAMNDTFLMVILVGFIKSVDDNIFVISLLFVLVAFCDGFHGAGSDFVYGKYF